MTAISVDAHVSPDRHLYLTLPQDFPAGPVKVIIESAEAWPQEPVAPQSALGRRLKGIRQMALAAGMATLTQDQVLAEVRRRRGEAVEDA